MGNKMKKVKGWVAMLWTGHDDCLDKECERRGIWNKSEVQDYISRAVNKTERTFCNSWRGAVVF